MKIRTWQFLPFDVKNNSMLIEKIKAEGVIQGEAYPDRVQTHGICVQGLYFILGGRDSIAEFLENSPEGYFHGNKLVVSYSRHNTVTKHYTIVAITPHSDHRFLTASKDPWITLIENSGARISFDDIVNKLKGYEARLTMMIAGTAVGRTGAGGGFNTSTPGQVAHIAAQRRVEATRGNAFGRR